MTIITRPTPKELLALIRDDLRNALFQVDNALALMDDLALALGYETPDEQATAETYLVMHCPPGKDEAHSISACGPACIQMGDTLTGRSFHSALELFDRIAQNELANVVSVEPKEKP